MSAVRVIKPKQPPDPARQDREFHLGVREAILVFLRAYERRYLPDLKSCSRQDYQG